MDKKLLDVGQIKIPCARVPKVSFEFFPPKTEALAQKQWEAFRMLARLSPAYVSVTYGAGGSTREQTYQLIKRIKTESSVIPAAHLTCIGATKKETQGLAESYQAIGVNHLVALRGDLPHMKGAYHPGRDGYAYADGLVKGLLEIGNFDISVAAYPEVHPEAISEEADLDHLKRKQDNGAKRAITQYCFDTDKILSFRDKAQKRGISIPIIPGIMPVNHFSQLVNFSNRCGASVPSWVIKIFEHKDDVPEVRDKLAAIVAAEQCRLLLQEGIEEFHFYTMNRADIVLPVCMMLGVNPKNLDRN